MRDSRRSLSLRASDDWSPAVPPRLNAGDEPQDCSGKFFSSKPAPRASCVLSARTSPLRDAVLVLHVVVDREADVFVRIGDELIAQQHLNGTASTLQEVTADVSRLAEGVSEIEVAVDIRFIDGEGTAGIF